MDDDKSMWACSISVPSNAPDNYKKHALLNLKEDVGRKLYSILEQNRTPAVVEIKERIVKSGDYWQETDEVIINVRVTPVTFRHIEIPKLDTNFAPVASPTFFERLRYAITGRW